jgi:hypothetical protein
VAHRNLAGLGSSPEWSPDGRWVGYATVSADSTGRGLSVYSIENDAEHVVLDVDGMLVHWSFAPDGGAVATMVPSGENVTIQLVRFVGGDPQPPQFFDSLWYHDLYWQP